MVRKPRILLLFCGGTIIMKPSPLGSLKPPEDEEEAISMILNLEPRLYDYVDLDLSYIANMDSTNMTPREWERIGREIYEKYEDYDGFVITHGTDTMAYTSSALSLMLKNLGKPVILTGAQIPASFIYSDARTNLINAVRVASMDLSGVYIVFAHRIIWGHRATKASESSLDAFRSVNYPDAGEIRIDIKLSDEVPSRHSGKLEFQPGFENDIFVLSLFPGQDVSDLEFLLDNEKIKGVIIRAFGTGNVPINFDRFLIKAREKRVPVVITSQCLHGTTMMNQYELGRKALELGAIEGKDHSLEMLVVKLMWAIKHLSYERVKEVF